MGKNNQFIEAQKRITRAANRIVPTAYASIAIVLSNRGWSFEEIEELFFDSQQVWNECTSNQEDMIEKCFKETGIDMRLE